MMKKHLLSIILLCLLFSLTACNRQTSGNSSTSDGNTQLSGKHHVAIEVNNYGTIEVELDADTAPITVTNFINLANSGEIFLDGKKFNPKEHLIGYLPEERGLYPKKKVSEQLVYLGRLRGLSKAEAKKNTDKWLKRLHVTDRLLVIHQLLMETLSYPASTMLPLK